MIGKEKERIVEFFFIKTEFILRNSVPNLSIRSVIVIAMVNRNRSWLSEFS